MVAEKISTKKSIENLLKNVTVIDENINVEQLIKNNLESFKMDNSTIRYLIDTCHNNNEKILNELTKLKLYKMEDPTKLITRNDIDLIVIKEYDDNVFDLVNAITNRNKAKALELYQRLSEKEESTVIVATIANKIRLLYGIKILRDKKYTMDEMADILGVKKGAVSISLESCDNFSTSRLLNLLKELSDLDIRSKTGSKNLDIQFKLFLMNI